MNFTKIIPFLFISLMLVACSPEIDGTSEKTYSESLKKIKAELSEAENDSLSKCIEAIVTKDASILEIDMEKVRKDFNGLTANDLFSKGAIILEENRKKEEEAQHFLDSLTAVIVADSTAKYKESGNWTIKHFVDEFQQETKEGYIIILCNGTFSNSATTNSELTAEVVVTDKEELQLFLNEYGSQPVKSYGSSSTLYNIKLLKNGVELQSTGKMYSDRITVKDEKVMDFIRSGGNMKVFIKENSRYSVGATYLFEFDATNYDKAISILNK